MKKLLAFALAMILCLPVFALTGCQKDKPAEKPTEATELPATEEAPVIGQMGGGWTINAEPVTTEFPEEAVTAFNDAISGLDGANYELIGYLGSQVVAGTNFAFVCRKTVVSPDAEPALCTVKVFRDLSGASSILDITEFALSDYTSDGDVNFTPENLAGGWTIDPALPAAVLPEEVQKAFDTATAGMMGVGYQPIAFLGSQVVAGSNYAILCNATSVTAEPQSALAIVTIYADLEGGATITSICGFEMP